jgi:DNA adenine methylase
MNPSMSVTPFLKWPGGKRWFVARHGTVLPRTFRRYIEPFLGSGSVFFHLQPSSAILGDSNEELIAAYRGVRDCWRGVERLLRRHQTAHSAMHYYRVRASNPTRLVPRAARIIYLNRACFNGIYRVNRDGIFNVPKGTRSTVVFPTDDFQGIARLLKRASLRSTDFEELVDEARRGDLIFADPPYTIQHNDNGFIKYNEVLFSWDDQVRLADALDRARNRGAQIVSTNANHPSLRQLYIDRGFAMGATTRFSSISAAASSRKVLHELVILCNKAAGEQR